MEVCAVVQSIITAFNNGLDVFKRIGDKRKSKKRTKELMNEAELQLQESLQRRPQEIRLSYDRGVAKLGHRFEIGDTIAHTSLAHTLLVLNAGLINIINNALSDDPKKKSRSQPIPLRSLLNISEVAASDAIHALSQLDIRLSSTQLAITAGPNLRHSRQNGSQEQSEKAKRHKKIIIEGSNNPFKQAKRPAPSPLLARGGWVRSKSNSSVSAAASSSKINVVRPNHRRTKSSPLVSTKEAREDRSQPVPDVPARSQTVPVIADGTAELPAGNETAHHRRPRTSSNPHSHSHPHREPSMLLVSSDMFAIQAPNQQIQRLPQPPPPIPPKIPLHSRPTISPATAPQRSTRHRPPSVATFMTASTKIGEIPEPLSPSEERERPLPYTIPPPLVPGFGEERKKVKGRGFRFWKRGEDKERLGPVGSGKEIVVF